MTPQKINSVEEYKSLCDKYMQKGSLTNNYLLPAEVEQLVAAEKISTIEGTKNCYFLVKKNSGCKRLYYVVNDINENIVLPDNTVTEILFRTPAGAPEKEVSYLLKMGFRENLIRDQYSAKVPEVHDINVEFSANLEEAKKTATLFNATFDKYSGDFISLEETKELQNNNSLIVVKDDGILKGAMHITLQGTTLWISHVVVFPEYRGQGVAKKLMSMYFSEAHRLNAKRLMLWVQRQNEPAVKMYRKYKFLPTNKSTISLIKD